MDRFDGLLDQVERQFRRASSEVSLETKLYANKRLTEITADIQKVTRENAYQDYLLDELQAEKEKFQLFVEFRQSDVDDEGEFLAGRYHDELRERPVCTCGGKFGHRCPLKRGRLPREVRTAQNVDDGIREFKASHGGQPLVLLDAQEEFAAFVGEVEQDLRELLAVITTDEIPSDASVPSAELEAQHSD